MHRDNHGFKELLDPQGVVEAWRHQAERCHPFDWEAVEEICFLHFEGYFLNLKQHFRLPKSLPNGTAIATLLEEKALELTLELPFKMTDPIPLPAMEAERLAYTIRLMRMVAIVVRALHNELSAEVKF